MLYHGIEQRLMIWRWTSSGEPNTASVPVMPFMRDYQFRVVSTRNQLLEKIYIFEGGLDDRVLEIFKLLLQAHGDQSGEALEGELLFGPLDPGPDGVAYLGFEHLGSSNPGSFCVPREGCDQLLKNLAGKLPSLQTQAGKWLRVDRTFAASFLPQFL